MLFEKIRYLVDAHFKEKEKIVKSSITKKTKNSESNQVLDNLNQHKKIKPHFKKIIALVRHVYEDLIAESKKPPISLNQSQAQEQENVSELGDKVESLHNTKVPFDQQIGVAAKETLTRLETPRFNINLQA